MKRIELYRKIKARFIDAGLESAETDARLILENALKIRREDLVLEADCEVPEAELAKAEEMTRRRLAGEPVSKIRGFREFWGLEFEVTRDTLDPRPDSETLIEAVLQHIPDPSAPLRILDIGTGTGCLAISLLSELPNASGIAIDISPEALSVARRNIKRHGLEDRLEALDMGWQDLNSDMIFDVVISNPPYISTQEEETLSVEVRAFDPHLALFAGPEGLDAYRGIAGRLSDVLDENHGFAALEIGMSQAREVSEIFRKNGFEIDKLYQDLAGRDRCLIVKPAPALKKS